MDLKKFFKLVEKLKRTEGALTEDELAVVDAVLDKRADLMASVDKTSELVEKLEKAETKISKLEDDNFKYRERARTQDVEVDEAVKKASKKLEAEIERLKGDLEKQANEAATAQLRLALLQTGVSEELLDKAMKLVDDTHYSEETVKGEDGNETKVKVFDREKFREDNAILFTGTGSKLKGIGGAGRREKQPTTTLQTAEKYLQSQYSRPDKKGS